MNNVDKKIKDFNFESLKEVSKLNDLIIEDFEKSLEQIDKKRKERYAKLKDELELIVTCSTFNVEIIGPVLADILSLYKGETYNLVVDKLKQKNSSFKFYTNYSFESVNGEKINLIDLESLDYDVIKFYDYGIRHMKCYDQTSIDITSHDILNYDFIKSFIDYVISYRLKNNCKALSLEELKLLEREFVLQHKIEIEKIQLEAYQKDIVNVETLQNERHLRLQKIINLNNDKKDEE